MKLRSRQALKDYMDFYQITSGYALAKRAGILPGTANFLVQGHRETCSTRTARAIESALACPPGFLFTQGKRTITGPPRARIIQVGPRRARLSFEVPQRSGV